MRTYVCIYVRIYQFKASFSLCYPNYAESIKLAWCLLAFRA